MGRRISRGPRSRAVVNRYDGLVNGGQHIQINGDRREIPGDCSLETLLEILDLGDRRVAVAINRDIVPATRYGQTSIADGDRIEILEAVGGG